MATTRRTLDRRSLLAGTGLLAAAAATGLTVSGLTVPAAHAAELDRRGTQLGLWGLAYYDGRTDGTDDPALKDAVSAFQKDRALTVDGNAGAETTAELAAVVSHVQRRTGEAQDGWYGEKTVASVQDFQRRWGGLRTDGRADAATMTALEVPRVKNPDTSEPPEDPGKPSDDDFGGDFNTPITRKQVINRAMVWVNNKRPYSMEKADVGPENDPKILWRTDCSGFVSMALNLRFDDNPTGLTTSTLHPDGGYGVSRAISKDELKPGDFLDMLGRDSPSGIGHVVLFNGWADEARTSYHVLEQAAGSGGTTARVVKYPYDSGLYKPFRYTKIAD